MHNLVLPPEMMGQFVYLGMAVMAAGNTIGCSGFLNLVVLDLAVGQPLLLEPGLEESPAAAATVIVGPVGLHIDKVFLTHDRFHHKPQILCYGVTVTFADDLTGILDRKFYFEILVPVRIDLELAFPDPLGIVFINIFDFTFMIDVEFFQSLQD